MSQVITTQPPSSILLQPLDILESTNNPATAPAIKATEDKQCCWFRDDKGDGCLASFCTLACGLDGQRGDCSCCGECMVDCYDGLSWDSGANDYRENDFGNGDCGEVDAEGNYGDNDHGGSDDNQVEDGNCGEVDVEGDYGDNDCGGSDDNQIEDNGAGDCGEYCDD